MDHQFYLPSEALGGGLCSHANHLTNDAANLVTTAPRNRISAIFMMTIIALFSLALASQAPAQPLGTTRQAPNQTRKARVNGVELHYIEQGAGTPVIFVHGGLDDYRYWKAQMEPFSQRYRVIAYSRRYNYPNNNLPVRPDHSAIVEAEDLAALIELLRLGRVHVVGASYGAYTALFLAVRHPEMVRTLVLAEAPVLRWAQDKPEGRALFAEFMGSLWRPASEAFRRGNNEQALSLTVNYFAGEGAFGQAPDALRRYWMGNLLEWRALTTSRDAFPPLRREDVRRINAPTLLLSGERTLHIHKFVDTELQSLLWKGKRVIIPKASHDMWSEHPEACRQATLTFLARQGGAPQGRRPTTACSRPRTGRLSSSKACVAAEAGR